MPKAILSMAQLLEEAGFKSQSLRRGQVVTGTVLEITPKEVVLDIKAKSEGIIPTSEIDQFSSLKVGDQISASVLVSENDRGQTLLTLHYAPAKPGFKLQKLFQIFEKSEEITVAVRSQNRGGLLVDFEGIRGFIPASQFDPSYLGKLENLIGQKLQVKIVEIDAENQRVIFSQKKALGKKLLEKQKEQLLKIKIGEKVKGEATRILPFGILVNVKGLEGLIHISEISWEKVQNLQELFKVGDKVEALVLGILEKEARLNLSLKQLTPDPWQDLSKKYSQNQEIKGVVKRVSPYGVFIQLEPGIEGLLHISKIPPGKEYSMGEEVACFIESINLEQRRISLTPVLTEKPVTYK